MNGIRILIVEDQTIVARDLAQRLKGLGYEVVGCACDAVEALRITEHSRPQVVLMDIHLPGDMDGIQAAISIREKHGIPVVFLTAYAEEGTLQRAKKAEPYGYIIKPFEDRELRAALEVAVHKHSVECRLRASEETHRTILDTSLDGFFLADASGRFLEVNQAFAVMTGYTRAELLELDAGALDGLDAGPGLVEAMRLVLTSGSTRIERRQRRKDGRLITVEISLKAMAPSDGRVFGFLRDVTRSRELELEREHLVSALQASESSYRGLFNTIRLAIYIQDAEGRFLDVNDGAVAMYGYARDEFIGQTPDFLSAPDRNNLALVQEKISRAFAGEPQQFEFWGRRKNGEIFPKDVRLYRGSYSGRAVLIAIAADITESKQFEERLRQAYKMEAIGRLAGGVAHDFNNILAAMMLQIGLLQLNLSHDPQNLADVRELGRIAERAAAVTRQLLVFSRRSVLNPEPIQLNEVLDDLSRMLLRLLGETIELSFQGTPDLPPIHADPGMIQQIVLNLCVNARDAMPRGGKLNLTTSVVRIDSPTQASHPNALPGTYVRLTLQDDGVGMDAETQRRIFEPFFTSKEPGKGTGLGLAIVYGIVQQHHGWIDVQSEPGQGTTFHVHFPAIALDPNSPPPPRSQPTSPRLPAPPGGTETLLLVEDNESLRRSLASYLRQLGYSLHEAMDGPTALDVWARHSETIALVISDMVMPGGMTGLELAERLRTQRPNLPVIISSGYSAELVSGAPPVRNTSFLPKPYLPNEIALAIRSSLDSPPLPPASSQPAR
jgi:PAS domain S-box-containing protein